MSKIKTPPASPPPSGSIPESDSEVPGKPSSIASQGAELPQGLTPPRPETKPPVQLKPGTSPAEGLKPPGEAVPGHRVKAGGRSKDGEVPPGKPAKADAETDTQDGVQGAGGFGWLVDSLFDVAAALFGEKFRPGDAIDLQPFFSEAHSKQMDTLASRVLLLKPVQRYKMMAHLLSTGGRFQYYLPSGMQENVALEGLTQPNARLVLPAVFAGVTRLTQDFLITEGSEGAGKASEWKQFLGRMGECWDSEKNLSDLRQVIYGPGGKSQPSSELEVVLTGWQYPSGHAVGFVYAFEEGEPFIYACNTGRFGDTRRTVVKFSITEDALFEDFLKFGDRVTDWVRKLWDSGPESIGLQRCPEEAQIPLKIARVTQRRGNCPITARKSCQLAMLWSLGVREGLSPEEIKTVYKITSTLVREVGVRAALNEADSDFLGNALIAMLSKWDRPGCRRDSYRVADAILKHHGEPESGLEHSRVALEELKNEASLDFLKRALEVAEIDLNKVDKHGWRLIDYARRYHNREVVALLHRLEES